jgi:hypothetical protein
MRKKTTRKQVGGNIDELTRLIYENVPIEMGSNINPLWASYITRPPHVLTQQSQDSHSLEEPLSITELFKGLINTPNSRGQTPLYLACLNCNLRLYNLLRNYGVDFETKTPMNSTILHGVAWGNDKRPGGAPTYEEKERMLQMIIPYIPRLVLDKNAMGETFYHNLMSKHPNKIPLETKEKICSSIGLG